jgi:transposase
VSRTAFQELVPSGLIVDEVVIGADAIGVSARPAACASACPGCGHASQRVHSRYWRQLLDLPSHGRSVRIRIAVRRFRCSDPSCPKRTFTERLDETITRPSARRTGRLESIVHRLGVALGGRPASSLARRLMMPVSRDTLLRAVRRRPVRPMRPPRVVGIDDWAWRRGHRYGTIVCDLERREIIDLLPDREVATVRAWLAAHPGIEIVARDRAGGYAQAAAQGAPQAIQVADRWHLLENASAAFVEAVRRHIRPIREAVGAVAIDPTVLTAAEKRQFEGWERRKQTSDAVIALKGEGGALKEIARRTGLARQTVRGIISGTGADVFRIRESSLDAFAAMLDAEWATGCRKGAELWRRLRAKGYTGSLRVVSEWATRKRRDEADASGRPRKVPAARMIARMMTTQRDAPSKDVAGMLATIEAAVPALTMARDLLDRFHDMVRHRKPADLEPWIEAAKESPIASLANGIAIDQAAVRAALIEPWSSGQVEAQIHKLKLVKRQMYGRANLDLLRARLIAAPT